MLNKLLIILVVSMWSFSAFSEEEKDPDFCRDTECRLEFMDRYPEDDLEFWMLVAMEAKQGYSLDDVFDLWNKDKTIVIPDLDKAWMGSYYNLPLMRLDYRKEFYDELNNAESKTRKKLDPIASEMLNEYPKDVIEEAMETISMLYYLSIRGEIDDYMSKYSVENLKKH